MRGEVPEGWSTRPLGSFLTRVIRKNHDGRDLEPLSITKDQGVVLQRLKYNKRIATDPLKYVIGLDGDFAYDPMSLYYGSIGRIAGIGEGLISPDYVVLQADATVDHDYLLHHLRSPSMLPIYELYSETSNSRGKRRRLYWSVLAEVTIALPPLPEQKKIAAILSSVDDAIRATQAVIDQTRRVKEGLLHDLLTRGIGPDGKPHTRFQQTEIGMVPEAWCVGALDSALEAISGGRSPAAADEPALRDDWGVLKVSAIGAGKFHPEQNKALPQGFEVDPSHIVHGGDVLVTRANTATLVGASCRVPAGHYRLMLSDKTLRLSPHIERLLPDFLVLVLNQPRARAYFEAVATGSSASMKNVSQVKIRDFVVPFPPINEQREITEIVLRVAESEQSAAHTLSQIRAVRSALLSDLLTGRVRVTP